MNEMNLIEHSNEIIADHSDVICDYLDDWSTKCSDESISLTFSEISNDIKNKNIANAMIKLIFVIKIFVNEQMQNKQNITEDDYTYILDLALGIINALAINSSTNIRSIIIKNNEDIL